MASAERFRDDGRTIDDFTVDVLVRCPRCDATAHVRSAPATSVASADARPTRPWNELRRVVCAACSFTRTQPRRSVAFGGPFDPYFRLPLRLQAPCLGHVLWVYNAAHLDHLLDFIEASVRERYVGEPARSTSMVERLPEWMVTANHRDDVSSTLRSFRRLLLD